MLFRIKAYLKFLLKSTNEHGVHSPFVFDLVTKCFYAKTNEELKEKYNNYVTYLIQNDSVIEVEDFGAGSKVFKSEKRNVSKIVEVVALKKKYAFLLMRLIPYLKINKVLELGTSVGVSSASMAFSNSKLKLTTLEGCKNTLAVAINAFEYFHLNIKSFQGEFTENLSSVVGNNEFDFVYFDGNHTKKATLEYFYKTLDSVHNNSLFIFDDIHWSKEMEEAWEEIKKHDKVKVTIDTFQWGFVFFRKEQEKEHFIIRL